MRSLLEFFISILYETICSMNKFSDSSTTVQNCLKRQHTFKFPELRQKKPRRDTLKKAVFHIKTIGLPLLQTSTGRICESICLEPNKHYTIGRKRKFCDFVVTDNRVSKKHCQLLFDSVNNKIYLSDGVLIGRSKFDDSFSRNRTEFSLNGVFVNGIRVDKFVEVRVGDVVSIACGKGDQSCSVLGAKIGFLVERVIFTEEVDHRSTTELGSSNNLRFEHCGTINKTTALVSWCRDVLNSDDPVTSIRKCFVLDQDRRDSACRNGSNNCFTVSSNDNFEFCLNEQPQIECGNRKRVFSRIVEAVEKYEDASISKSIVFSTENTEFKCANFVDNANANRRGRTDSIGIQLERGILVNDNPVCLSPEKTDTAHKKEVSDCNHGDQLMSPGKKFCLNRPQATGQGREVLKDTVSLPELLHPVKNLVRVFITTFTNDILWFLSYCKIPSHLPVTVVCHSTERCWNVDPDARISVPFSDFPNVTVVYPLFPEVIAFNKDRKNSGIACHHPKLLMLQREDNMRIVITSANLVPKQWLNVTNTVWWQDFPRLAVPDYFSLFSQLSIGTDLKCDFTAQLVGFVSSLVSDTPSQAYWILELIKYNFEEAVGYLVTSVPGIHSNRTPSISRSKHLLLGNGLKLESSQAKLLTFVETSVVGSSYIYHVSTDSNGARLRKLASFVKNCDENLDGMSEIILKRDKNMPADWNAVGVFLRSSQDAALEDFVQLGFLPKHVAKWVAPLSDDGLFAFSAYICPKEVLATALEGSNSKVKLILYVHAGPCYYNISEDKLVEYSSAICSLVASSHRCTGLGRLKEVLGQYKWPEHLESEFVYGSSSVGSIDAKFLAAFSEAAGKRSLSLSESEESDPDWGCWDVCLETRNPSVGIIFPSIEKMKNNRSVILASRRMVCFSQKTWQRLKNVGILHDAIPYPINRNEFPMHVKVGRRRFKSTHDKSSFGWVYCGSHNFSAAAWGRPILNRQYSGTVANDSVQRPRLHIANYELGIIFIVPPPDFVDRGKQALENLDDITLPFVVPPPKYTPIDQPATTFAMKNALAELTRQELVPTEAVSDTTEDQMEEEIPDEEEDEVLEIEKHITLEDVKAYADRLWSQVRSSQNP